MSPEAVFAVAPIDTASLAPLAMPAPMQAQAGSGDFGNMVVQGLEQVNSQILNSQTSLQQLAVGNVENLHQLMMHMEEAKMSFQLLMQVRSRALEAYQDIMKMQV